ncbi:hypothetical protein SAMN05518865_1203 [Duganella sp. CF458]|uniref:hypothetical protein n=1 Tax=Duganella sp. CF458 TaxID=1884368 RepID=UPI0008F12271|nr:hypothetical protein [Duganella sp. CF458]SFG83803.1 hypothetical protein SAMN05518865_1203 [Duganella sp. CF458]
MKPHSIGIGFLSGRILKITERHMKSNVRKTLLSLLLCSPMLASAGSKTLSVAFFDYSNGVGKTSFKALRASGYEHQCWHESFVEIEGIDTAYIEKPPASLQSDLLLRAVRGDASAAEQFRQQLEKTRLDGAYAFVPDPSGKYATIYGLGYQTISVTSSASVRLPVDGNPIANNTFSKRLCEAGKAMD